MMQRSLAMGALAASLFFGAGSALAQGFGSISSGGPEWHGSRPATAAGTDAAGSVAPAPAAAAPAPVNPSSAFSSGGPVAAPAPAPLPGPEPAAAPAPESAPAAAAAVTVPFGSVSSGASTAASAGAYVAADRVLVKKSERRLYLMRANQIIAEYPIRLGLNPQGHKVREGDFRTPEGTYELVRRNPRSEFFLSLEVSYPNEADRERARKAGVAPGGLIMIHGQPNVRRKSPEYYENFDWTNGCIAVSNSDMVDIWLRTGLGTPIEIRP